MTSTDEWARLLHELGVGVYKPGEVGGNIFIPKLPDSPDLAIAVARYGGSEADSRNGWDEPRFQFRIRGPHTDTRLGEELAQRVYDELHGLSNRLMPGGTWLNLAVGMQSGPNDFGPDAKHRPQWTVNIRADIERATRHRT